MAGWTNEAGEPIMSGEAWRAEQALDMREPDGAHMEGVLTPAQASEYWITLRRDWYWLDLGVPFGEAVRRACDDWATFQLNGHNKEA